MSCSPVHCHTTHSGKTTSLWPECSISWAASASTARITHESRSTGFQPVSGGNGQGGLYRRKTGKMPVLPESPVNNPGPDRNAGRIYFLPFGRGRACSPLPRVPAEFRRADPNSGR